MTVSWPVTGLLGRLSEPSRAAMLALGATARLPVGRCLMRIGEPSTHAHLLIDGYVKVYGNDSGQEPLLAIRGAGDLVGEMGVLSGGPRSATVTVCAPTAARTISAADLRAFLRRDAEAAFALSCLIAERLRWANQRRVDFSAIDAPVRVCRVLVTLAEMYGRPSADGVRMAVSLTQADVASLAGVGLATAEKALRTLVREGIVSWGYRQLTVRDPGALRLRADAPNLPTGGW